MTPSEAQRVAQAAIFREWAGLIEAGLATREILRYWRLAWCQPVGSATWLGHYQFRDV
jgi:hypothetical protein